MGLGKTITTLTAISEMLKAGEAKRVLVIAPLRVARSTWKEEVARWEHVAHLRVVQILGTAEQRRKAMRQRADVYLINRENVAWLVAEHFDVVERVDPKSFRGTVRKYMGNKQIRPWIWDTVVIDESSSFKNHTAKRWKALRRVRKLFQRCIQLTGTPSPNGLTDLWAQLYLLDQGKRLGGTITLFRNRWFEPPGYNQFKWSLKTLTQDTGEVVHWAEAQIRDRVKDICFALKAEDYLALPPVMYQTQKAYLSERELKAYREMERRSVLELEGQEITALNAGALANKLLQMANGAVYTQHPNWVRLHDRKLEVLAELLEDATGPVIVAYTYMSDLKRITPLLTKLKLRWRQLRTGEDGELWNAGKLDVLVLHPESAGHGLNLHYSGSELLIWFGLTFNLEHYQQTNARLAGGHRRKERNVVIQHIVTEGTRDQRVMRALADKSATQDRLVEAVRHIIKEVKGE